MPGRQPMSMLGLTLNSVYSFEVIKDAELLRACRMMASNSIPESALPPADDEWDLKAVHIGVWHERDASTKCPPLACLRIFLRLSDSPLLHMYLERSGMPQSIEEERCVFVDQIWGDFSSMRQESADRRQSKVRRSSVALGTGIAAGRKMSGQADIPQGGSDSAATPPAPEKKRRSSQVMMSAMASKLSSTPNSPRGTRNSEANIKRMERLPSTMSPEGLKEAQQLHARQQRQEDKHRKHMLHFCVMGAIHAAQAYYQDLRTTNAFGRCVVSATGSEDAPSLGRRLSHQLGEQKHAELSPRSTTNLLLRYSYFFAALPEVRENPRARDCASAALNSLLMSRRWRNRALRESATLRRRSRSLWTRSRSCTRRSRSMTSSRATSKTRSSFLARRRR